MASRKEKLVVEKDVIVSEYVDDSEVEDSFSGVFSQVQDEIDVPEEVVANENLVPTFVFSSPQRFTVGLPKGKSKTNLSKGKRSRKSTIIDGDCLNNLESSKVNQHKIYYEKAQTSQLLEKFNRIKVSLVARIEEMHLKKLFTLNDCVKSFMSEYIPISMYIPKPLSTDCLSGLLKVDTESTFIRSISASLELQELMRRTMLETKGLNVCCCGYIYVHPSLCYARHPSDPTLLAGKITNTSENAILLKKTDILSQLNSLRFFLEILHECHTLKK